MSLVDGYENSILDFIFGAGSNGLAPATWYLGVSTADPTDSGAFMAEPSSGGYARVAITNNSTNFLAAASGQKVNGLTFDFPMATGSWGTLTHWALFSSGVATIPMFYGELTPNKLIQSGDVLRIPSGGMIITAD